MIGERFNFEDVFFRDLTVCVLDTLEGQVKWINRFTSGDRFVQVPFYYSLTGDERFLLDSFADDIVSENRFIELNTDMIPRGHLTMTGFNIKSDEFANPNVWLRMVVENEIEIRKVLARVRAIPITVNYELEILLSNEVDTFKCSQALMDTMWLYKYMYFEHNFMNIDAVILMPDNNSIEMAREKNLTSDNNIKLKCSFTVETYYPSFRRDRVKQVGYPRPYGSGMRDSNGYSMTGGFSDFFYQGSETGDIIQTDGGGDAPNTGGTLDITSVTSQRPPRNRPHGVPEVNPGDLNSFTPTLNSTTNVVNTYATTLGGIENNPISINGTGSTTNTGGYGVTSSFFDNQSGVGGGNPFGTNANDEYQSISPKRTRWFNNILRARERATRNNMNPNAGDPNTQNDGDQPNQ